MYLDHGTQRRAGREGSKWHAEEKLSQWFRGSCVVEPTRHTLTTCSRCSNGSGLIVTMSIA